MRAVEQIGEILNRLEHEIQAGSCDELHGDILRLLAESTERIHALRASYVLNCVAGGMTHAAVAKRLGVTQGRVTQIHTRNVATRNNNVLSESH